MIAFCLAIFFGAFLLFLVQPLIAKFILPWFGGTPAVWTTCMLFFQVGLLGGYAYAHWLVKQWTPRRQVLVHVGLLVLALLFIPVVPGASWKPVDGSTPTLRILLLLASCVGLPYLALAATGPLMQAWFSQANPGRSPYRLYSLSNAGSLLALLAYPFVVEPNLSRQSQAVWWSLGLGVFAVLMGWCGWLVWRKVNPIQAQRQPEPSSPPVTPAPLESANPFQANPGEIVMNVELSQPTPSPAENGRHLIPVGWLWFALPACGSALLLAVTNRLCYDIAVIPFLWVLPLSLYLLSFIISFDSPRWYWRPFWLVLLAVALGIAGLMTFGPDLSAPEGGFWKPLRWLLSVGGGLTMFKAIAVYLGVMFCCCMVCHGELYRLRPAPTHLTAYYLMIAAGGAGGGFFVAVLAPALFKGYFELHTTLWLAGFLAAAAVLCDPARAGRRWRPLALWPLVIVGLAGFGWGLIKDVRDNTAGALAVKRNFYGVLKVDEYSANYPEWHKILLQHGTTTHGLQYVAEEKRNLPTSYYVASSGIGLVMKHHPQEEQRRVGVVGLGTGSMAAWGRAGDHFRFYEINPAVVDLARQQFTYLSNCAATVEIVMGDARLSLERESPQAFDVLVLDAFSSDAIPTHLLTREAFAIYLRHLRPNGVLAVHISNKYLNLEPVILAAIKHYRLHHVLVSNSEEESHEDEATRDDFYHSDWMLLARKPAVLELEPIALAATKPDATNSVVMTWTDDRSDLFRILVADDDGWLAAVRRFLLPDIKP